jgi:SAGA-associated factor 73
MVDTPKMLKCNHCKRTVTEHAMPKHIERCLNKKQEKQRKKKEAKDARDAAARKEKGQESDEEEDGERSAVKGGAASKKRKAADEAEEGIPTKKKKKKDEAKAKASKPKAPVDVERQCGVDLPQGGQCARSLTCKSHSGSQASCSWAQRALRQTTHGVSAQKRCEATKSSLRCQRAGSRRRHRALRSNR